MELVVASCFVEPALVGSWRGVGERRRVFRLAKIGLQELFLYNVE